MPRHRRIVVLTGAGISAESGLGTFRDVDGLWTRYDLDDVATPEGFARNPALVHAFYNARRRNLLEARPNAGHAALARLEREAGARVTVVTQNIDNLHEQAGSANVIHMHGELLKVRCHAAGHVTAWEGDLDAATPCPRCPGGGGAAGTAAAPGSLRPHVVWFGEFPLELDRIQAELDGCDLFLSIGTSGSVYPAAGFVAEVRARGRAHAVELNLEPSEGESLFAEKIYGPATEVVPAFVEKLLAG
ncbi:MAG: NAD-dependent deacylase [Alphaproteobacteria bacterium]|nr:NAD-dependent deacylase [Alphaproteobacteria bacterium]